MSAIIEFDNVPQFLEGLRDHPELAVFQVIETGVEYHRAAPFPPPERIDVEGVTLRFYVLAKVEMLTGCVEVRHCCGDYHCALYNAPPVPAAAEELLWQIREAAEELQLDVRHGYKPFGLSPTGG